MVRFVSLLVLGLLAFSLANAQIPPGATTLMPVVRAETSRLWPSVPHSGYIGGLIEHESCITLTHSRCWSPRSRFRTPKEEGGGVGQLTRAFNPDGTIRFDSLSDIRRRHPSELGELSWSSLYTRPDLQIRAVLLMSRENYKATSAMAANPMQALMFADAAYNGGLRGLQRERAACGLSSTCNPGVWVGNVERYCLKSKSPLYAGRSACDINRHHVSDVMKRAERYK